MFTDIYSNILIIISLPFEKTRPAVKYTLNTHINKSKPYILKAEIHMPVSRIFNYKLSLYK